MAKLQKKLAAAKKRRQRQPRPQVRDVSPIGAAAMRRISQDYPDLLQNIEAVLVNQYRIDPEVDDRVAMNALRALILGDPPTDGATRDAWAALVEVRQFRTEFSDDLFGDAVRVVMDSVRRHSNLRPGETGYFDFVSAFLP